nr:zinc finger, CCHC-type [Tanacetum cinerariifolium]
MDHQIWPGFGFVVSWVLHGKPIFPSKDEASVILINNLTVLMLHGPDMHGNFDRHALELLEKMMTLDLDEQSRQAHAQMRPGPPNARMHGFQPQLVAGGGGPGHHYGKPRGGPSGGSNRYLGGNPSGGGYNPHPSRGIGPYPPPQAYEEGLMMKLLDGSFVKIGNIATESIKGIGRVLLNFTSGKTLCLDNVLYVPGIRKNLVSEIVLNKCGYKQVLKIDKYILSRHGSFVGFGYVCNGMIRLNLNYLLFNASACMITSSHSNSLSKSKLWHAKLGYVHHKRMRDMSKMSLIHAFDMTHESCKTCMLTKITRQPFKSVNWESKVLDLIHSDLCDFHANPSLGHNKYVITFIDNASKYCYVYLLHAKHEALDKFKIYKQEVELQRQDLIKVLRTDRGGKYYDPVYFQSAGIIHQTTAPYTPQQNGELYNESRDAIFDEERFTSIPRPRGMIQPSLSKIAEDEVEGIDDVPGPSVRKKSTRTRKAKSFGYDFQLYLVEGARDNTLSQREYCFIIEEDPKTLSEAMASRDVAFWNEAVQRCKWILKRKMKVDGSIDKYKAGLVIQGFRQKEGIDFFDTYAPVCRISTIRLLLALAAIHDLVIHQIDVTTAFLNGDLDKKIYTKQPEGFVMPGHESNIKLTSVCYGIDKFVELALVEDAKSVGMNRGFSFLDFPTRPDTLEACRRLQKRDVIFGTEWTARIAFADTLIEPDNEVMAQVRTIFVDGLTPSWEEDIINEQLRQFGKIEKVKLARNMPAKRDDFGFITFSTHESAVSCVHVGGDSHGSYSSWEGGSNRIDSHRFTDRGRRSIQDHSPYDGGRRRSFDSRDERGYDVLISDRLGSRRPYNTSIDISFKRRSPDLHLRGSSTEILTHHVELARWKILQGPFLVFLVEELPICTMKMIKSGGRN